MRRLKRKRTVPNVPPKVNARRRVLKQTQRPDVLLRRRRPQQRRLQPVNRVKPLLGPAVPAGQRLQQRGQPKVHRTPPVAVLPVLVGHVRPPLLKHVPPPFGPPRPRHRHLVAAVVFVPPPFARRLAPVPFVPPNRVVPVAPLPLVVHRPPPLRVGPLLPPVLRRVPKKPAGQPAFVAPALGHVALQVVVGVVRPRLVLPLLHLDGLAWVVPAARLVVRARVAVMVTFVRARRLVPVVVPLPLAVRLPPVVRRKRKPNPKPKPPFVTRRPPVVCYRRREPNPRP